MKKSCMVVLIVLGIALATAVYGFDNENTTLKNKDSKTYEFTIRTSGGGIVSDDGALNDNRVIYDSGVRNGRINSHSQISICKGGCELTLTETGQTITVDPGDTIVIDKGVLKEQ